MSRGRRSIVPTVLLWLAFLVMGPGFLSAQKSPLSKGGAAAPSNVTVVGGATSVLVSWTPVSSRGVTYRVLRALDSGAPGVDLTTPLDAASFVDGRVAPGTTYFYQVVAMYPDGTVGAAAPVALTFVGGTIVQPAALPSRAAGGVSGQPVAPAPSAMAARPPLIPVAGPAPTGVAVTGTPLVARLTWNAMPNAQRYAVWRGEGAGVSVELTPAGFTGTQFQDVLPDPRVTYRYAVVAYYPNGTSAEAPVVLFTSPPMKNPPGFTARDQGQGTVSFQWQAVPGALKYRLDGTGLPNTGFFVTNVGASHPNIPAGPGSWRLVALYPGNYADYPGASVVSTVVRVLPPHSLPWLTKNNGAGAISQVQLPAHQDNANPTTSAASGELFPVYSPPGYANWLNLATCIDFSVALPSYPSGVRRCANDLTDTPGGYAARRGVDLFNHRDLYEVGLRVWLGTSAPWVYDVGQKVWLSTSWPFWDESAGQVKEAVYGNPGDLGVGRRAACEQKLRGPPAPGLFTVCYATAHGIPPGQPGFNDLQTITHPGAGVGNDFILSMMITKDATGSVFLVFSGADSYLTEWARDVHYTLSPTATLDTEGPKLVPFACLSCHGGKYNPVTRKVDGASLLPLDPGLLAFASPGDQAAQEEKIRKINQVIQNSDPGSAVAAYIRGLYNGAFSQPGARAQPDYVPAGWAPQAGFYRSIVRPYCTTCHLAAPSQWNFASWGNFLSNAGLIRAAVCGAHTMPHSELQYKAFWTKDTGALYLPGLLATTLGFPSCP
jgi:hypothetical protein